MLAQLKEQVLWFDGHGAAITVVILSKSHYHILNMPVLFAIDAVISFACFVNSLPIRWDTTSESRKHRTHISFIVQMCFYIRRYLGS